jgi:hypothetical protein
MPAYALKSRRVLQLRKDLADKREDHESLVYQCWRLAMDGVRERRFGETLREIFGAVAKLAPMPHCQDYDFFPVVAIEGEIGATPQLDHPFAKLRRQAFVAGVEGRPCP